MISARYLVPGHGLRIRPTLCHHLEGVCAPPSQATLAAQAAAAAAAAARAQVEALAALEHAQRRVERSQAIAADRARKKNTDTADNRVRRALEAKKAGRSSYLPPLVVDGQVLNVQYLDR